LRSHPALQAVEKSASTKKVEVQAKVKVQVKAEMKQVGSSLNLDLNLSLLPSLRPRLGKDAPWAKRLSWQPREGR